MAEENLMTWRTIARSPGRQTDELPLQNGWLIRESYWTNAEAGGKAIVAVSLCFVPKAEDKNEA